MDSQTLTCCLGYLLTHSLVKKYKVLARDQLSLINFTNLPLALIVNCSDSNSKGSHWISFYIYKIGYEIVGDYFDSYNNLLSRYNIIPPFSIRHHSSKVLQSSNSIVCGLYALFFIYVRSRGKSLKYFESRFGLNLLNNDKKIRFYYKFLSRLKTGKRNKKKLICCTRLVNNL